MSGGGVQEALNAMFGVWEAREWLCGHWTPVVYVALWLGPAGGQALEGPTKTQEVCSTSPGELASTRVSA